MEQAPPARLLCQKYNMIPWIQGAELAGGYLGGMALMSWVFGRKFWTPKRMLLLVVSGAALIYYFEGVLFAVYFCLIMIFPLGGSFEEK